jgi:hypothetical protein
MLNGFWVLGVLEGVHAFVELIARAQLGAACRAQKKKHNGYYYRYR